MNDGLAEPEETDGCDSFSRQDLFDVFSGTSDTARAERVLEHLDGCETCQRIADSMLQSLDAEVDNAPWAAAQTGLVLEESDRERANRLLGKAMRRLSWNAVTGHGHPTRIGKHYEVLRVLDTGGMSEVLECMDRRLGRRVAVKVLGEVKLDSNRLERLQREAMIQSGLRHPNIVAVHEVEFDSFPPFIVMELMEGGTLREAVRQVIPPPKTAARVVARLAQALQVAHEQGVIHRDIKPSNVLLAESFDPTLDRLDEAIVKLADFGLARQTDSKMGLTRSDLLAGTPAYMSPEQTEGKSDRLTAQSDIYSLGVLLYELITGRPPLLTDDLQLTLAMIREVTPVEPRQLQPNVSKDLNTICMKCLEKDPKARYGTAADLARDLDHYLAGRPILARPIGLTPRLWRWCRRNRALAAWMVVAIASLLGLGLGGAGFAISQARLRETAQQETRRALDAEKQSRAAQLHAEAMETQAEAALKDAEYSRQQAQNESDLSRSYFFSSMRALDQATLKIGMARKAENQSLAMDSIEKEIRKSFDSILSGFSEWPASLAGKQEDVLDSLTPLQLERLFRDAAALFDLGRSVESKALMNELIALFARTPVGHPDYVSRLIVDIKSRTYMTQVLEAEGKTDEAIRLLQPAFEPLIDSIDKYRENRPMIVASYAAGLRLSELMLKEGRKSEANDVIARIRPIYGVYEAIAHEGETRLPLSKTIPKMPGK